MNNFASYKFLFPLLLVLILGFGLFHFLKIQNSFYQLQFDWKKKEVLETFEIKTIKNFSANTLTIENKNFKPDNQFTYSLKTDQEYYFRFNHSNQSKKYLELTDLIWLTNKPSNLNNVKNISKIELPLKQKPTDKKIVMIGNQLIYSNEAKYLRKEIKKHKDVYFVGNIKDVYNNSFINIDDSKISIPESVDYIIVFSYSYTNNFYKELNRILKNDQIKLILIKNPELINNSKINFDLAKLNKNITPISIDPNTILNKNTSIFYYDDNKYLTLKAYQKIANLISKELK